MTTAQATTAIQRRVRATTTAQPTMAERRPTDDDGGSRRRRSGGADRRRRRRREGDATGRAAPEAGRSLPEVTAPLATLQRRAERPGETRLLGPLDPALTRDLAAAAARSPHARWEITIVDDRGYATGHGIARPRRGKRQQPQPPGPGLCALPARVNITVTETLLQPTADRPQPRSGAPPGDWHLAPRTAEDRGRRLGTDPARRPGTHRPVRRRAHPRLRPPAPGQHLPAKRPAPPPRPGPRPRVHLPALLPARPRIRLRTRHPLRQGRKDRRLQRRRPQPPMPPGQTNARLEGHPAETRMARMDDPDGTDLRPGTLAVHRITTRAETTMEDSRADRGQDPRSSLRRRSRAESESPRRLSSARASQA